MHYSKLLGIHILEQAAREQAGEGAVGAADQRPPPSQGQKSLYCTAMEAIRGEAHSKEALDTENKFVLCIFFCFRSLTLGL